MTSTTNDENTVDAAVAIHGATHPDARLSGAPLRRPSRRLSLVTSPRRHVGGLTYPRNIRDLPAVWSVWSMASTTTDTDLR